MTVKDLMQFLNTCDPNLPVRVSSDEDPTQAEISDICGIHFMTRIDLYRIRMRESDINIIEPLDSTKVAVLLVQGVLDVGDDEDEEEPD